MGVNSLSKTVTRQCHCCDLNPVSSAPESSTLTTRLPSHSECERPENDGQRKLRDWNLMDKLLIKY